MRPFANNDPLSDAELNRLGDFLKGCKGGEAMNLVARCKGIGSIRTVNNLKRGGFEG